MMSELESVHPNPARANHQAAYHPAPAAMATPGAPGYPPGHAHGTSHPIHAYPGQCSYNQGAAPHAPYPCGQGHPYPPQGAYPVVVMPPPPQPPPNRERGFFKACLEAFSCCYLRNVADPNGVNGGDVCCCYDCFGAAGDICLM